MNGAGKVAALNMRIPTSFLQELFVLANHLICFAMERVWNYRKGRCENETLKSGGLEGVIRKTRERERRNKTRQH